MADCCVEAEFVRQERAFLRRARNPNHTTAVNLGDLPRRLPHAAGCRRHHHGLARLRLALHLDTSVRREPQHAEDAHCRGDGRNARIETAREHVAEDVDALPHQAIVLPAVGVEDEIAQRIARQVARHHLRRRAPVANIPHGLHPPATPAPLVRVQRKIDRPRKHLTRAGLWRRFFLQHKVPVRRPPSKRPSRQSPNAVYGHAPPIISFANPDPATCGA